MTDVEALLGANGELPREPADADWVRSRRFASHLILLPALCMAQPAAAEVAPLVPVEDRAKAIECLTLAVAYEAGHESLEGQQAVAEVVLNRLRDPSFPKSVCDVVFAGSTRRTGCQFTFTCDGSLRRPMPERTLASAREVVEDEIDGRAPSRVLDATYYHADYVTPYWASTMVRLTKIGAHIFYRPSHAHDIDVRVPSGQLAVVASVSPGFAPWGLRVPTGSSSSQ